MYSAFTTYNEHNTEHLASRNDSPYLWFYRNLHTNMYSGDWVDCTSVSNIVMLLEQ